MNQKTAIDFIENQEWLGEAGEAIQPVILKAFKAGGETGQKIKNFLHGKWLGHPLHPALTDIPIGSWTIAAVLDTIELTGNNDYQHGADAAIATGIAGALASAISGLTDWTATSEKRQRVGLMHGLLNLTATSLYAISLVLRRRKNSRTSAIACSMVGYGVTTAAAYLGGHLVFDKQMGVNHTATSEEYPKDFVVVLQESELADNTMKCVKAGEIPVLLAKKDGNIFALANTCSHLGGPLAEGDLLDDCNVRCPWHGSVFSLKDGSVVNSPATEPQPKFDIRINNGMIEVKLAKN